MLPAPLDGADELYGPALATIHHEAHEELATEAGPAIVALLRRAQIHTGLIIDLGCGTGVLARYLSSHGYDVLGIDRSHAMLRIARRVAPRADFVQGRAERMAMPRCAAVTATGESITYVGAHQMPFELLQRHIARVARKLAPGGLFIFDAIVRNAARPMAYKAWRASRNWAVLVDVREDMHRHIVTRRITTFARKGACYRRASEVHRVGIYDRAAVLGELRRQGFRAHTLSGYGGEALPPGRMVFVGQLRHLP